MKTIEEIKKSLFSVKYIKEHGVSFKKLCSESYIDEKGVHHYDRMFDKPLDNGGVPFSGVAYKVSDNRRYIGYKEYKDGYQHGADVEYSLLGKLKCYSYADGIRKFCYKFHNNGAISYFKENHREDMPCYYRLKTFDEDGKLITQNINCEMQYFHNFAEPDPNFEVSFHENGEFRRISTSSPDPETLYSCIEFDENGCPTEFRVNPMYKPDHLYARRYRRGKEVFNGRFRFDGDVLMEKPKLGKFNAPLLRYDGKICFMTENGRIEKILDYENGLPLGEQNFYYLNSELRERYFVSADGTEYGHHIWWYENGIVSKVIIYCAAAEKKYTIQFDESGTTIRQEEEKMENEEKFMQIQKDLQKKISLIDSFSEDEIKTVAGVDLAYWKNDDEEYAVCCIVVIDYATHEVLEKKHYSGRIEVPYIPGFLAFRELPLVMKTAELLEIQPDIFIFDGNGYLHPRHMGIATHAAFHLGKPTIGIAKTYFRVDKETDYTEPENEAGSFTDIVIGGEVYGRALRTHKNVKPVFVSAGNDISLDTACSIALKLTEKESHIPVPTRLADLETHIEREKLEPVHIV